MQAVEIELDGGEAVRAEAGAMLYMDQGIEMQTSTGGGLFKGFKRMVAGESFFITTFLNQAKEKKRQVVARGTSTKPGAPRAGAAGGSAGWHSECNLSPRAAGGSRPRRNRRARWTRRQAPSAVRCGASWCKSIGPVGCTTTCGWRWTAS